MILSIGQNRTGKSCLCYESHANSFCEKAQSACGVKSEQTPLRRRDALQFQKREARFLEFRDFRAGVQDVADHQVQMRFVAEAKHDFGLHRLQFAQQIGGRAGALSARPCE